MDDDPTGKIIRLHRADGFKDLGRIVHFARDKSAVYWIPMPGMRPIQKKDEGEGSSAKVFYLKAPQRWEITDLDAKLGGPECNYSLVDFTEPPNWRYTDEELKKGESRSDLGLKHRRDMPAWLSKRQLLQSWIKPIVECFSNYELLELGRLNDEVQMRAKALGHKDPTKVARAMRLHLLGSGHPNALLPAWGDIGCAGQRKLPKTKCGRPPRCVSRGRSAEKGFVLDEPSRSALVAGWRKHKRGVSEYSAYLLTCEEYWPGKEEVVGKDGRHYLLALVHKRPTFAQFRYAAHQHRLSATRANMSDRVHSLTARALRGKADDQVVAIGQLGLIDSTSEDQTPVSSVSRLKVLPSTWRTIEMDVKTGYILGLHSGFEHPSTLTSLLAILHGATSKVEFCARYGIEITEELWHSRMCKRVRSDNGELKSEAGIRTLNSSECATEFVRSYAAELKGPVEGGHHSMHRRADHGAAGSTRGKRREPGEPKPEDSACRTHFEHMPIVIKSILYHNNEKLVPELLTVDMRRKGVIPTRKGVYEWYEENGYVSSEPWNLALLRTRCLPRISGRIHRDGIYLVDPCDTHYPPRLIRQLRYSNDWLIRSGLLEKAGRKVLDCEVMLDPNDLSRCYFDHCGKVHELERRTSDPRANELTLCEHLAMIADDQDAIDSLVEQVQQADAQLLLENRKINANAMAAKRKEQSESSAKSGQKGHQKRKNRDEELERSRLAALGLNPERSSRSAEAKTDSAPFNPPFAPSSESTSDLLEFLQTQWEES